MLHAIFRHVPCMYVIVCVTQKSNCDIIATWKHSIRDEKE
jgi:hypothetical protein